MKSKEFPQQNLVLKGPPKSGIKDLPAFGNGLLFITCWQLNDKDIEKLIETRTLWVAIHSGAAAPPVIPQTEYPFYDYVNAEAFSMLYYKVIGAQSGLMVWNSGDLPAPKVITKQGKNYELTIDALHQLRPDPTKALAKGYYFFRKATLEEAQARFDELRQLYKEELAILSDQPLNDRLCEIRETATNYAVLCQRQLGGTDTVLL